MQSTVGIVIPAYSPNIKKLLKYIQSIDSEIDDPVIQVELDSPEKTAEKHLKSTPASVNRVPHRRGKGAAIRQGFSKLDTDILAFVDADGSTSANQLKMLINTIATEQADLAIGSRRHPDSEKHLYDEYHRKYLGDIFAIISRSLLNVQLYDYQCGVKAFSASCWNELRPNSYERNFGWDIEILSLAHMHGFDIKEIPIRWCDCTESTVSPLKTPIDLLRAVFVACWRTNLRTTKIRYICDNINHNLKERLNINIVDN